MTGSAFMLVSIVALAVLSHAGPGGTISFDLLKVVASSSVGTNTARWLFLGFAIAFAVKTPIFPFHTWLPDAHTEAPTAGSIDLAGVLLKLGTYGFLRYGLFLFPEASIWFAPVLMTLAVIGIIYGADGGGHAAQPQAAGRLLVGRPHGVRRARRVRPHRSRASRARSW